LFAVDSSPHNDRAQACAEPLVRPIEITRALFAPGRNLGILQVGVKNRPGSISKVTDVISRASVNVIQLMITNPSIEKTATVELLIFVDTTDAALDLEELTSQLKSIDVVEVVTMLKPQLPNFIADTSYFPTQMLGERFAIFRFPVLRALVETIRKMVGSAGVIALYLEGQAMGRDLFDSYRTQFQEIVAGNDLRIFELMGSAMGWARFEIINANDENKTATVRAYDSWECGIGRKTVAGKNYAQLLRGLLAGFFTRHFQTEMVAVESKCVAAGDSYCEFNITKAKED